MSETLQQVEALIARGLALYEHGNVDAAILVWEEALNLDPENARANGYVDYVRMHYEVLTGGPAHEELAVDVPFGVSTAVAPEYRISIAPFGAAPPKVNLAGIDAVDEGWFLEADALVSQFAEFEPPISPVGAPVGAHLGAPVAVARELEVGNDVAQVSGELDSGAVDADHPIDSVDTVIAVSPPAAPAFEDAPLQVQEASAPDVGAAFEMTADEPSADESDDSDRASFDGTSAPMADDLRANTVSFDALNDADAAFEMTADEPGADESDRASYDGAIASSSSDAVNDEAAAFEMTADEPSADESDESNLANFDGDFAVADAQRANTVSFDAVNDADAPPMDFASSNELTGFEPASDASEPDELALSTTPTLDFSDEAVRDASVGDVTATQINVGAATSATRSVEYDSDEPTAAFVPGQLEFEADEPDLANYGASYAEDLDASFGVAATANEPDDEPVAASSSSPAIEFESLQTGVRQRDNGFVATRSRRKSNAPELKMTLRTPTSLDDIDLDQLQADAELPPVEPAPAPISRTVSRPTSQLVGLARRPLPLRSDEASTPSIFIPATPSLGRGKTRSDLFPVSNAALIPPAAGQTEDLAHSASAAVHAALVIESIEVPSAADEAALDQAALDDNDEDTRFDAPGPAAVTQALGRAATEHEPVLAFDPIAAGAATLLREIDVHAVPDETRDDRVRRRISSLLDFAARSAQTGELHRAVTAIDLALSQDPESALGQKLIHRHRDAILHVLQQFLGNMSHRPKVAKPMHELGGTFIGPRAAFLVSRVDGDISYDELLDVSGMPRMEAYRYLCQLVMRGVLV